MDAISSEELQFPDEIIHALVERKIWYCGKCKSLIPCDYWHRCDDKEAHSGPSHDDRRKW